MFFDDLLPEQPAPSFFGDLVGTVSPVTGKQYIEVNPAPSAGEDVAKSLGIGAVQGALSLTDLPYWLDRGLQKGNELLQKYGPEGLTVPREPGFTRGKPSEVIQREIETVTGPFYQPQTKAGEYARTVGEFVPAVVTGPGGLVRRALTQAVAPGLASEGAGQLAKGTAAEPYARIGGALLGGGVGSVASSATMARAPLKGVPTTKELFDQGGNLYKTAEAQGMTIMQSAMRKLADDIGNALAKRGTDQGLHPEALSVFKRIDAAGNQNVSLEGLEILRRLANEALQSPLKRERDRAHLIRDSIDDFIKNLKPSDVMVSGDMKVATKTLQEARVNWAKASKAETIERLISKAELASSRFTGSGYENALRNEFRKLAGNDNAMRRFSAAEQDAIRKVVKGGPLDNAMRALGRLSIRGPVSGAPAIAGGLTALGGGGMGPLAGGLALGGLGELGRSAATGLTSRNVNNVLALTRGGQGIPNRSGQDALLELIKSMYLAGPQIGGFSP